jgi:hypothetical protein
MVPPEEMTGRHMHLGKAADYIPEGAGITRRFLLLRVAERFGLDPAAVWAKSPGEQAELVVFERMREEQEGKLAAAMIGVRL